MALTTHAILDALLDQTMEAIVVLDASDHIREWNDAAERLWGSERGEVLGRPWSAIDPDRALDLSLSPRDSVAQQCATVRRPDGQPLSVNASVRILEDADAQRVGRLIQARAAPSDEREATDGGRERRLSEALRALRRSHEELKSTQLQLIQAARLDSLGRLAAGVAHEVKNPLAIVLTGLQLLQRRTPPDATATHELLEDLETAVKRANSVVVGLLDLAASTALTPKEVDLDEVVSRALHMVQHELQTRGVRLERESATTLPKLCIDAGKIEQILINFLINAMDAMPSGGTLTIRTSLRPATRQGHGVGLRRSDVLRLGQTVAAIEVEDTGPGLRPDVLARAFEPFYTTKRAGKGTGLGLAVCRMIANLHRGSVWLENRAEGGTRATLWLPAGESQKGARR